MPQGKSTVYGYNNLNKVINKTQSAETPATWVYTYDLTGNLITETQPNGNVVTTDYDELNRPINKSDLIGAISSFTYDANSNIKTQTGGNGNITTHTYNALNQRVTSLKPMSRNYSYTYNVFDELTSETSPNGTITYTINSLGQKTHATGPDNFNEIYGYDVNNNITSYTDSRGTTTTYTVNVLDQTTDQITESFSKTMSFDTLDNKLTETDYRGTTNSFEFDKENRQLTFTRAGQLQQSVVYNSAGLTQSEIDANGNTTVHQYNSQYYKTQTNLPETQVIKYTPDTFGDIVFQDNPGANDITQVFDLRRRIISQTNGEGEQTQYEYDLNNNRTAMIKPNNNRWEYGFDQANRPTSVNNIPEDINTTIAYNNKDNITSITDAMNKTTMFTYDNFNRRLSKTYQDTSVESYTYDPNGNLKTVDLASGDSFSYQYDELNRQYSQVHVSGADVTEVTFTLDANGNIEQATETFNGLSSSITADFDNLDRITQITNHDGNTIRFTYDANGNRKQLNDPKNSQSSYVFDDLNRLTQAVAVGTGAFDYVYNTAGLLKEISNNSNGKSEFTYDLANRIETIINSQSGVPMATYNYQYDPNGNRISVTQTNVNATEMITYSFDNADRMTQVTYPDVTVSYGLDKVGNRITESSDNGISTITKTYTHNNRDQITTITDTNGLNMTYSYDASGNRTEHNKNGNITTFDYNPRQRIKSITKNGITTSFKYDYLGNRIEKTSNGQTTRYTYDGTSLLYETNTIGNVLAKYHYGSDRILAETRNGQNSYIYHDALRTPVVITNQDGSIQNRLDYDAWGNLRSESGSSEHPKGFTGYHYDPETGLYYAKARYYDPEEGVFLREDPLQGDFNNPPSLHRYNYAASNPTAFIDPTGKANDTSHYYEALLIGKLVGLNEGQMLTYAIGAQIGDEFEHHDAIENSTAYVFSKGLFPYAVAVRNNCGAHALCDTRPGLVREAVSEYTLNFAKNYAEIGTADHANTDSYYHIKEGTLGTENELLHSGIIGHLFELQYTDKAFLHHETKRKKAFEARAKLLFEYTKQQGTQTMNELQFKEELNKMLASLDQQQEKLVGPFKDTPEFIAPLRKLVTDDSEFRSMRVLLKEYGITQFHRTEAHDLSHNIDGFLINFSHSQLKEIALEMDPKIGIHLDRLEKKHLATWLSAKFNMAQNKSKIFIYNSVTRKKGESDSIKEDSDGPGIEEVSK